MSIFALSLAAHALADEGLSAQTYALEARLDPVAREVVGTLEQRFTNRSQRPLEQLVFHLYLNAFATRSTVFMRESRGSLRGERSRGPGSLVLESLRVGGRDVLASAERELVPRDQTQLRVRLERPIAEGASTTIESRFVAKLPGAFARSGYAGEFFAVTQWFPKLAKLEPDGSFASHPYHALGEFYADFADYSLTVRAPADFAVLASGKAARAERVGGERVHRFSAPHVHDVAFVAARGFVEHTRQLGEVELRLLLPPGYEGVRALHEQVIARGLPYFSQRYGPYPYPQLSVILPPRSARGAGAMEYPTLFLTAGEWFSLASLPSLSGALVTAHELAHQWFQGMVASDEVAHPVLDEGLAEWAGLDLLRALYGPREGVFGVRIDRFELERLHAQIARSVAAGGPAFSYSAREYAGSVYARAALALESIRRAHGRARFERALAHYAEAGRFRHATPALLAASFDAAYGPGFAARVLVPLLFDGASSSVHLAVARSDPRGRGFSTYVRARRTGSVALPTSVALYDARGGELARRRFAAERDLFEERITTERPVARVVVDPDRALLLDERVSDQVAELATSSGGTWLARVLALFGLLLSWCGP